MSLMNSYFMATMVSRVIPDDLKASIKEQLNAAKNEFLLTIAGNMPVDSLNDMVTKKVEVDANLSADEVAEREALVEQFKDVIETAGGGEENNKLENITEAISASPDEWGQILSDANVTPEVLEHMETAIQNGESISGDLVNIAYGAVTGAATNLAEKYKDEPDKTDSPEQSATTEADAPSTESTVESTTEATKSEEEKANDKYQQSISFFGLSSQDSAYTADKGLGE